MKKRILLGCLFSVAVSFAHAQVKIGANPTTIQNSSLLELENEAADGNNQKGLQLPKVALTATNVWAPMAGPAANGMTVYNTNADVTGPTANGAGAYIWYSSRWNPFTDWSLVGNNITSTQVLGTNNAQNLNIRAGGSNRISINAETGQTLYGGANMAVPRVYIARPAPGGITPGLYVETSTGFNSATSANIVVGNAAGHSLQGLYGFANGAYEEVVSGKVSAGISYRNNGTLSFGVATEPYGPGDGTADKLVINSSGDVIVQGTLRTRVTRVALTNSVAGGVTGTPTELSNNTSSYISLAPTATNNAYLVPSAAANPGLMLILKNNISANPAVLSAAAGGTFVNGASITSTFSLAHADNTSSITIISDGSRWQITAIN
jgi:hypothetical protein